MLGGYIKPHIFIISFAIGILYIYLSQPTKEVVYRFPNPTNVNHLVYKDKNDGCYKYKLEERNCSELSKDQIKSQPVIEDFNKDKKLKKEEK